MDTLSIIAIAVLVIILIIIIAALHAQQSSQLREIQNKLEQIQDHETKVMRSPDSLRHKRKDLIEQLMIIESELQAGRRTEITEQEFLNFDASRQEIIDINEQLKMLDSWIGHPFDLDWVEILGQLPTIQTLRTKQDFQVEEVPAITSGN
jgi:type II secretory pathway component PulK